MSTPDNTINDHQPARTSPLAQSDPCECTFIVEPLFDDGPHPEQSPKSFDCHDCGVNPHGDLTSEIYMVTEDVWKLSGLCGCRLLCIGCLERRIGRLLDSADFTTCPLNYENVLGLRPVTPRLLHRLFTPHGRLNVLHEWVTAMYDDFYFGDKHFGGSEMASFDYDMADHPHSEELGAILRMFG